jgi:hypothetical protein
MRYRSLIIFLLCLGLSLVDALRYGHWWRAGFWLALVIGWAAIDHLLFRRARPTARSSTQSAGSEL